MAARAVAAITARSHGSGSTEGGVSCADASRVRSSTTRPSRRLWSCSAARRSGVAGASPSLSSSRPTWRVVRGPRISCERSATIRRPAASCSTTASAAESSARDSSPSSPGSPPASDRAVRSPAANEAAERVSPLIGRTKSTADPPAHRGRRQQAREPREDEPAPHQRPAGDEQGQMVEIGDHDAPDADAALCHLRRGCGEVLGGGGSRSGQLPHGRPRDPVPLSVEDGQAAARPVGQGASRLEIDTAPPAGRRVRLADERGGGVSRPGVLLGGEVVDPAADPPGRQGDQGDQAHQRDGHEGGEQPPPQRSEARRGAG